MNFLPSQVTQHLYFCTECSVTHPCSHGYALRYTCGHRRPKHCRITPPPGPVCLSYLTAVSKGATLTHFSVYATATDKLFNTPEKCGLSRVLGAAWMQPIPDCMKNLTVCRDRHSVHAHCSVFTTTGQVKPHWTIGWKTDMYFMGKINFISPESSVSVHVMKLQVQINHHIVCVRCS